MSDFKTRLYEERDQLDERLSKLSTFIGTDNFYGIPENQQMLLKLQQKSMETYLACLNARIYELTKEIERDTN